MATIVRRTLIRQSLLGVGALVVGRSLAEWSPHRALYDGRLDHLDFPAKAKNEFGIAAVEYVNGFFGGRTW